MKILAIGDFHGKFPNKFEQVIKKEKIDLVVSVGDYAPFHYRKLWFKYCYGNKVSLWEIIGKEKYKKLIEKDQDIGESVLKKFDKLPVRVFTVLGNIDYPIANDVMDEKIPSGKKYFDVEWNQHSMFIKRLSKYKNIRRIDYTFAKFGDYVFIGMRGHSFPGRVKSKAFKKHRKILDNLFKKFAKENKQHRVIFVSHTPPKNTKLDKISMKAAKEVRGKHFGSKLTRRVIERHQPVLNLCGHTHEAFGVDKIGKTVCVNTGAVHEGKGAIIEFNDANKDKQIKVKFIK
jgi:Icc-related predicted phosphoesterase